MTIGQLHRITVAKLKALDYDEVITDGGVPVAVLIPYDVYMRCQEKTRQLILEAMANSEDMQETLEKCEEVLRETVQDSSDTGMS